MASHHLLNGGPNIRQTRRYYRSIPRHDRLLAYAVLYPGSTLVGEIQEEGLQSIYPSRENSFSAAARLELVPQCKVFRAILRWQKTKDPLRCCVFRFQLVLPIA